MTGKCWEDKCWAEVTAWDSWSLDHVVESRRIENGTYFTVSDFIDRTANELMEKGNYYVTYSRGAYGNYPECDGTFWVPTPW